MTRRINEEGIKMMKQWEGFVDYAYDDFDPPTRRRIIRAGDVVRGTLTIGYGSTGPHVKPGMRITEREGLQLFVKDLDRFERFVDRSVRVPLNDNQFAALVSFCYNVGEGTLARSTLLKKLNAGDYDSVPRELMKFVNSKGRRMQGLVNRRAAEAGLWAKGSFVSSNYVPAASEPNTTGATAAGATGGVTSLAVAEPVLTKIVEQQENITSGDFVRIAIAVVIVGVAVFFVYRQMNND